MAAHIDRAAAHVAARVLVDTCTITRPATSSELDPVTLQATTTSSVLFTGGCFVNLRPGDTGSAWVSIESLGRTEQKVRVRLPLSCPLLLHGDLIEVTASDNTGLVGTVLEVLEDGTGSYAVSKLATCRLRTRTT